MTVLLIYLGIPNIGCICKINASCSIPVTLCTRPSSTTDYVETAIVPRNENPRTIEGPERIFRWPANPDDFKVLVKPVGAANSDSIVIRIVLNLQVDYELAMILQNSRCDSTPLTVCRVALGVNV
jgi:hypothetical protein